MEEAEGAVAPGLGCSLLGGGDLGLLMQERGDPGLGSDAGETSRHCTRHHSQPAMQNCTLPCKMQTGNTNMSITSTDTNIETNTNTYLMQETSDKYSTNLSVLS